MKTPYINIHTHRRTGKGIEMLSLKAGIADNQWITDGRGAAYAAAHIEHEGGRRTAAAMSTGAPAGAMIYSGARSGEGARQSEMQGERGRETTTQGVETGVQADYPTPPFSIGVHPWQLAGARGLGSEAAARALGENPDALAVALREIERVPAAAIGEIGLDGAIQADYGEQKMVLAAQLRIAEERRLPVVLHCVRAFESTMEILAGYRLPAVIFHGFVGSHEQAARAIRAGHYISIGERSLASPKTVGALAHIPTERLFLETDELPLPIAEVYARAAKVLGIAIQELANVLYNNYITIFCK